MEFEIKNYHLLITLNEEERAELLRGRTLGDRPRITHPEAKVEVLPESLVDFRSKVVDYPREAEAFIEKRKCGDERKPQAEMLGNGDIRVIIPDVMLDPSIGGGVIPRDQIKTLFPEAYRTQALEMIPPGGIVFHFEDSPDVTY